MNICAICQQEQCGREEMCALFWNLDQNNDAYIDLDEIEPSEYELLEEELDI
jgi:hypothetical protein